MKTRLDRWLVLLHRGSRKQVQSLIRSGAVTVNGETANDPSASYETESDVLAVSGQMLDGRTQRHVMLYKPAGILTAARDAKQPTVMDLLPAEYGTIGCMPIGRLDKDTTGLLLLTTDGKLNHFLLSPGRHVSKKYRAVVTGRLDETDVRRFAEGLFLGDFTSLPSELRLLETGPDRSLAEVTVQEGKFHQVRRMFDAVGHEVLSLHRFSFGPLELDTGLKPGCWRELTEKELNLLRGAVQQENL